jgi:SAM-dependent methyltransferase
MTSNIAYETAEIARYFARNRVRWDQFYESERVLIERLGITDCGAILDIGCGCGGLGLALNEKFGARDYTGVEINVDAAQMARRMNPEAAIFQGDILVLSEHELSGKQFDVVFSLSCVDWNVRFGDMLATAWKHVRPGGYFVATFRLTAEDGCDDMARSYQYINYEGVREGELASYVVLNAASLCEQLTEFGPTRIEAFGYWGSPSATAVTPYDKLCFAAFAIQKRSPGDETPMQCALDLPDEIRQIIGSKAA